MTDTVGGFRPIAVFLIGMALTLSACASRGISDEMIEDQVRSALLSGADVPGAQLSVEVRDGVVILTGSTVCPDCGGTTTPGATGTVEQSIGAIVRAIPGVRSVEFLTHRDSP